jgi:hypothetical protein
MRADPEYMQRLAEQMVGTIERHAMQGMLVNSVRYHMTEPFGVTVELGHGTEYATFVEPPPDKDDAE